MNSWTKYVAFGGLLVALDQILKVLILKGVAADLGFVGIHLVPNTGASFGMLKEYGVALTWVAIAILGIILYFFNRFPKSMLLPFTVVTAGIVGNLIDRIRLGFVVDFFDLGWFPVFNVADACITIGAIWLVIVDLRMSWRKSRKAKIKS